MDHGIDGAPTLSLGIHYLVDVSENGCVYVTCLGLPALRRSLFVLKIDPVMVFNKDVQILGLKLLFFCFQLLLFDETISAPSKWQKCGPTIHIPSSLRSHTHTH